MARMPTVLRMPTVRREGLTCGTWRLLRGQGRLVRHTAIASALGVCLTFSLPVGAVAEPTSEAEASAIAALNAGTAAVQSGRALEAVDYFNQAIESSALSAEGSALAYHHRGIAHQKLSLTGHAVADYTSAIWHGGLPDNVLPRSYYNRAVAYAQMGQQERAERDYNKAIELLPDYAAAYHNRGNLRRHLERNAEAVDDYTRALALGMGAQAHLSHFARAISHHELGNVQAALGDTASALELKPDFAPARSALAEWGNAPAARQQVAQAAPPVSAPVPAAPAAVAPEPVTEVDPVVTASVSVAPLQEPPARSATPAAPAPPSNSAPQALTPSDMAAAPVRAPQPPAAVVAPPARIAQAADPSLDAVRIPTSRGAVPAARNGDPARVALIPPRTAAIQPETGNVTVNPLAEVLPPARSTNGWEATVTRYRQPENRVAAVARPAVPSEPRAADPIVTGAIRTGASPEQTSPSSNLLRPDTSAAVQRPVQVAQNSNGRASDAGQRPALRVQVGSFRSSADATKAWETIAGRHAELVGQRQPYIVEADLGARGIYYRLQLGPFGSNNEANAFCRAMKARGQDCIIAAR